MNNAQTLWIMYAVSEKLIKLANGSLVQDLHDTSSIDFGQSAWKAWNQHLLERLSKSKSLALLRQILTWPGSEKNEAKVWHESKKNKCQNWHLHFIFSESIHQNVWLDGRYQDILLSMNYLSTRFSNGQGHEKWSRLHFSEPGHSLISFSRIMSCVKMGSQKTASVIPSDEQSENLTMDL